MGGVEAPGLLHSNRGCIVTGKKCCHLVMGSRGLCYCVSRCPSPESDIQFPFSHST